MIDWRRHPVATAAGPPAVMALQVVCDAEASMERAASFRTVVLRPLVSTV
ncbi:MAG: hypothetical protein U0Q18_21265 [Bryobacteraceae bacterium]